jgi:hypothetical protein
MIVKNQHPLVYHVRKARSTGSEAQVLDNRDSDEGPRWILRCVRHDLDVDGEARLKAEARAHHPEQWCKKCAAAMKRAANDAAPAKPATKAKRTTSKRTTTKAVENLLARHATLREAHADAFAACETTDGAYTWDEETSRAIPTTLGKRLEKRRDAAFAKLAPVAEKLRSAGYALRNDDSVPVPASSEDAAAA